MTGDDKAQTGSLASLAGQLIAETAALDAELAEIGLMIEHARAEATRHEANRAALADRLSQRPSSASAEAVEVADLARQLVLLTKRSAVMEAQIDVLIGKQRALGRFRDSTAGTAERLAALSGTTPTAPRVEVAETGGGRPASRGTEQSRGTADHQAGGGTSILSTRTMLGAEDALRRQIARSLHDGPVQGLTNIALQAQIVERLAKERPERVADEVRSLVAMVQSTLETTKAFLHDVRPMVLDDLGLVPTLRRTARERARRSSGSVELESMGQDRRLPTDVESAVFRIVDDALTGYLATGADRVTVRLDWAERLAISVAASRAATGVDAPDDHEGEPADLPPALAAMIADRRATLRPHLSDLAWAEIGARTAAIDGTVDLADEGTVLRLSVPLGH
jgi:signal transduction histidine kinase